MEKPRQLELLAPARNLDCGIAAIDHGADAVYIGAERFGARAAAGNSLADIKQLVDYAHRFMARVYVTVNTIIYDDELSATEQLIRCLYEIGVDAILVQDMAIMRMSLPPIAIHASTQTDNRTSAKVKWLSEMGMRRVVLARELTLSEIKTIHEANPDVELEAFMHGALCVSYSGQCYASCFLKSRSANRGECSQICRLPFRLIDADGRQLGPAAHYLSLKDLCRIDRLGDLADAGICSFKIEGRLKEADYVKNIVAAYSKALDRVVAQSGGRYARSSMGRADYNFNPNPERSFNRQFTEFFIDGRKRGFASMLSPKSMGQPVEKVKEMGRNWFSVAGMSQIANGDGLCYFADEADGGKSLRGIRINKVEENRLYPLSMPRDLVRGTMIYRNHDAAFLSALSRKSAVRSIPVSLHLALNGNDLRLTMTILENEAFTVESSMNVDLQPSRSPQREGMARTLSKLGVTVYSVGRIDIDERLDGLFFPMSRLADLRRTTVEKLDNLILEKQKRTADEPQTRAERIDFADDACNPSPWSSNIANAEAAEFYRELGSTRIEKAFELNATPLNASRGPLMQCRYCLKFELGYCVKQGGKKHSWHEPLTLVANDGSRLRLEFDCRHCQMNVWSNRRAVTNGDKTERSGIGKTIERQ